MTQNPDNPNPTPRAGPPTPANEPKRGPAGMPGLTPKERALVMARRKAEAGAAKPAPNAPRLRAVPPSQGTNVPVAKPDPAAPPPATIVPAPEAPAHGKGIAARILVAAGRARLMPRHLNLFRIFLGVVIAPTLVTALYLFLWAADQYSSTLAFTTRSEESTSISSELLGGLGSSLGGTSSASDTDVLYEFLRSRDIVRAIDDKIDLRTLYSRPEADWLLSFDPDGTIEDLTDYWSRMTQISYDSSSGLMEIRVLAFRAEDAKLIADTVEAEASRLVNDLSATAREDAMHYASEDLDKAVERLKEAREALTTFRIRNQIVDITADLQGQTGILASLQAQLATALVDLDLLAGSTTRDGDVRVAQSERRIEVIRNRIEEERAKFGAQASTQSGENYATVVSEFERLTVDREFAETAYTAALANYDSAVAEANRRNRYLATYVRPTGAEKSEYPQRGLIAGLLLLFLFLVWSVGCLVYYSLRDRR